jgi:hypothetical protein
MTNRTLFKPYEFGEREKAEFDRDGQWSMPTAIPDKFPKPAG